LRNGAKNLRSKEKVLRVPAKKGWIWRRPGGWSVHRVKCSGPERRGEDAKRRDNCGPPGEKELGPEREKIGREVSWGELGWVNRRPSKNRYDQQKKEVHKKKKTSPRGGEGSAMEGGELKWTQCYPFLRRGWL